MFEEKRQTGRTTRMLEAAIKTASKGYYVIVICATAHDTEMLAIKTREMLKYHSGGQTKIYSESWRPGGQISFDSCNLDQWNWRLLIMTNAHSSCKYYIDHAAIEITFNGMLHELFRWDKDKQ